MRRYPRLTLGSLAAAGLVVACDDPRPVEPSIPPLQARVVGNGSQVAAPSNTSAVAVSVSQIDISWRDNSNNETRFEVRRSGGVGSTMVWSIAPNVVAFSDLGLVSGTTYCYDVRTVRVVGSSTVYSAFSNSSCATTPLPPSPPNEATGVSAVESGPTSVTVSWTDNSTNENGFRIYRSIDGAAPWELAGTASANATSWVSDQPVCYRVVAFNAAGGAPPSQYPGCTRPAAPGNLSIASMGDGMFELTWTDNSVIETVYEVWLTYFSPCCPGSGSCDLGAYEMLLAELPANSTSYQFAWNSPCVAAIIDVAARKYSGYSSNRDGGIGVPQ